MACLLLCAALGKGGATGAGEPFTGAMTLEILRCGDILRAVRYGCAAGALAATRLGAQPSLPTRQEVEDFIRARS